MIPGEWRILREHILDGSVRPASVDILSLTVAQNEELGTLVWNLTPRKRKRETIAAADIDEVMVEQLRYLMAHVNGGGCGCSDCARYWQAREILLGLFR